jgi:hypothetical protein
VPDPQHGIAVDEAAVARRAGDRETMRRIERLDDDRAILALGDA